MEQFYSRETELRHLQSNDVYRLGVILDENNCWKKLMEIIPKSINAMQCNTNDNLLEADDAQQQTYKYNNDHIRLIESAIKRPGESRLCAQILFDEWSTSGRKNERPTVGVLLQLLVKADLFRAADFVATQFLNEKPPPRPMHGPAACITLTLSDDIFADLEDFVNDSCYYPGTETLERLDTLSAAANINKDFYTKYHRMEKHELMAMQGSDNAPKAPPRPLRSARLEREAQQQATIAGTTATFNGMATTAEMPEQQEEENQMQHNGLENIPKFSELLTMATTANGSDACSSNINNGLYFTNTESTELTASAAPLPLTSLLVGQAQSTTNGVALDVQRGSSNAPSATNNMTDNKEMLSLINDLNINSAQTSAGACALAAAGTHAQPAAGESAQQAVGESAQQTAWESAQQAARESAQHAAAESAQSDSRSSSLSEDSSEAASDDASERMEDDDDEPRNSNNDSSLTSVTGTSGDNSFDLSMNCSASNDDIPDLSALRQ